LEMLVIWSTTDAKKNPKGSTRTCWIRLHILCLLLCPTDEALPIVATELEGDKILLLSCIPMSKQILTLLSLEVSGVLPLKARRSEVGINVLGWPLHDVAVWSTGLRISLFHP
jgi:hypothetical protein